MEDLLDLLKERLAVKLGCRHEGVLSQQNMLPAEGSVEVVVKNLKRLFVPSVEDDLDGVL